MLTSWPVLLPEMAAYPALRTQRTCLVRWRGRRSDSGMYSGLAHQPARAMAHGVPLCHGSTFTDFQLHLHPFIGM
jgi:hypothetical protein